MKKGFTLIEVLVVVSIISTLSSTILSSLRGARIQGRNSAIAQDVKQYELALQSYAVDKNALPIFQYTGNDWSKCVGLTDCIDNYDNGLVPNTSARPVDNTFMQQFSPYMSAFFDIPTGTINYDFGARGTLPMKGLIYACRAEVDDATGKMVACNDGIFYWPQEGTSCYYTNLKGKTSNRNDGKNSICFLEFTADSVID